MDAPGDELVTQAAASRRENVTARLQQREEERQARLLRKKDDSSSALSSQQQDRADRESLASAIVADADRIRDALRLAGDASAFQPLSADVQSLQRRLNDGVALLSSYDVRKAQELIDALRDDFQAHYARAQPKKKFAFAAKRRPQEPQQQHPPEMMAASCPGARTPDASGEKATSAPAATPAAAGDASGGSADGAALRAVPAADVADCIISGLQDVEVERSGDELRHKCVAVSTLSGCIVRLRGAPSAVRLSDLRGCTVLIGPVSSSVFIDDCVDCTFVVACHQLRVHGTTSSRFYVHVTSKPIVEDCTALGFAPYAWQYDGVDADFEASGLKSSRSAAVNRWDQVDDFNWLASDQPSPNWTVIPAEHRLAF